jgi:hypothetical protein
MIPVAADILRTALLAAVRRQTCTVRSIVQKAKLPLRGKVAVATKRRQADQMAVAVRIGHGHASESGDVAARGRNFANYRVGIIRDKDVSCTVHGYTVGLVDLGAGG